MAAGVKEESQEGVMTTLLCTYTGEEHEVHLALTPEDEATLASGGYLYCAGHQEFSVGRPPASRAYNAQEL